MNVTLSWKVMWRKITEVPEDTTTTPICLD